MSNTPEESLEILTNATFPGSIPKDDAIQPRQPDTPFTPETSEWRMLDRLRRALNEFSPYKASGTDGIKPIVLHSLPDTFLSKLLKIYDASITSGYTPSAWRESKVIYIPKLGKPTYDTPKAFRPITLTSYLFKGLEKLVYWNIEDNELKDKPYNDRQHAFRTGRSTESALSEILNEIEKGTLGNGFTIAVFFDCAGAFDNLSYKAAEKALKKKQIQPKIIRWYMNYLKNRTSTFELKGIAREISIETGCPQGGILSVLLWNVAFDMLLSRFTKGRVRCVGFADDGTLLISGKDLHKMRNQM